MASANGETVSTTDGSSDDLTTVLGLMSVRARRTLTLDGLIGDWKRFVGEVERGYSLTVYDYTNDLGTRRQLAEVINEVTPEVAREIEARLAQFDDRFRNATRPSSTPVGGGSQSQEEWWMFRIPWRLRGELKSDLGL